jgi:hypothetical protein
MSVRVEGNKKNYTGGENVGVDVEGYYRENLS